MNYANLNRWLQDLRTTAEPQTDGALHDKNGFCCLGRACVVAGVEPVEIGFGAYSYGDRTADLPDEVREWLGIGILDKFPGTGQSFQAHCMEMNDTQKMSFYEIADAIEEAFPLPFAFLIEPYRSRMIELYEALRSGKYEQGKASLNAEGKMCCLGVACEVALAADVAMEVMHEDYFERVSYDGSTATLPTKARVYFGFANDTGTYGDLDEDGFHTRSLTGDNDDRDKTFVEIAEIMASTPELFTDEARGAALDEQIEKLSKLTPEQFEWVFALSNGLYEQGQGTLCRLYDDKKFYCCLGVACDLAKEAGEPIDVQIASYVVRFDGKQDYMPRQVMQRLGLRDEQGKIGISRSSLANMNDNGYSFVEIAQAILDYHGELFT